MRFLPQCLITVLTLTIASFACNVVTSAEELLTRAEKSGFKSTSTTDEVQRFAEKLAESSDLVHLGSFGETVEGRSLPLLVIADPPVRNAREARDSGKVVCLAIGAIHGGEVCGKEALLMLARELVEEDSDNFLDQLVLCIVPVYNADGNDKIAQGNRPGQVGPQDGAGERRNARGLDLNRDFMRLEAPESRAFVRFLNEWDPHLFIDTHTTNGSAHRYLITYDGPKNPATDATVLDFARDTMFPSIARAFHEATGEHAFVYGNFGRSDETWTSYPANPRFGTTYVGLRDRLSILSEAYAYATFEARVRGTLAFVEATLQFTADHHQEVHQVLQDAREANASGAFETVPIGSKAQARPETSTVLGFEPIDGASARETYESSQPKDYEVRVVDRFRPTTSVSRPFAYAIPPGLAETVLPTLHQHGIELEILREDIDIPAEIDMISEMESIRAGYTGPASIRLQINRETKTGRLKAGSLIVKTAQPLGKLAVYLLEPLSDDGVATWGLLGDALAVGREFPMVRIARPLPLLTSQARATQLEETAKEPITFEVLRGRDRPDFNGRPVSVRWFDDTRLQENRDGQTMLVDAVSGEVKPLPGIDPEPIARALSHLPTIDEATAGSLARRVSNAREKRERGGSVLTFGDDLYYVSFDGSLATRLTSTLGLEELPELSPDGQFVAFVRGNDLFVVDVVTGTERALTTGGDARHRSGKNDWVYFEELYSRSWKGFWWSPDSKHIAFLQLEDEDLENHTVLDDTGPRRVVEETPYPFAGDPNPKAKMGIAPVTGGPVLYPELPGYLAGEFLISYVGWFPDGNSALCYVQNRVQNWLDVLKVPVDGSTPVKLFRDQTEAWIESPGSPTFLPDGTFLWSSERTGWKHLYHYEPDGTLIKQITTGDWEARQIEYVNNEKRMIYVTGTFDCHIAEDLYQVSLDDLCVERLTHERGHHQIQVAPAGEFFIDTWSSVLQPSKVALRSLDDGALIRMIDNNPVPDLEKYRFGARELVQIPTPDGFVLEGELILPPDFDDSKLYPVWFQTYGGPHYPTIRDSWAGARAEDQALASEGFIVFRADPRSASGKGAVSAWSAYKQLGIQELADIETAIEWLSERPYVDTQRIGMTGHSYGGFMTSFVMTHSTKFAAGIAGAPVTDWRNYDTIYTERYMLTPQENPEGYAKTSVVEAAEDLHGKLMIVHGAKDDNVSLRNTYRLVEALQRANVDFELMIYPGSRHGIFSPHYRELRINFIRRTLGGGPRDHSDSHDLRSPVGATTIGGKD